LKLDTFEFCCGKKMMSSDIGALRRLLNIVEALPRPMLVIGTQSALYAHFKLAKSVHREELNKHGWEVSLLVDELASIMVLSRQR
jgi:hypothetical protein